MGGNYFTNPLVFLIDVLFSIYIMVIMLRLLLAWVRADFYNPISQFIVKVTNPLLIPLRRVVPSLGGLDLATILLMFMLQLVALGLMLAITGNNPVHPALLVITIGKLIELAFNVFIMSIFIQVILSWVNPGAHTPVSALLFSLTEPVLRPVRGVIPPISGIDLSPLVALVGLQILKMLVLPLFTLALPVQFMH